jgi:hypothetical protein
MSASLGSHQEAERRRGHEYNAVGFSSWSTLSIADESCERGWAENLTKFAGSFDLVKFSLELSDAAELDIQVASDGANLEAELIDDGSQSSVGSSRVQELCAQVLGASSARCHMDEST